MKHPRLVNQRCAAFWIALKLVYGTLIRASKRWQEVSMPSLVLAQLRNIRNIMQPESEQSERHICFIMGDYRKAGFGDADLAVGYHCV